jgi:NADH:ubiquinone oxidoreductase subunit E
MKWENQAMNNTPKESSTESLKPWNIMTEANYEELLRSKDETIEDLIASIQAIRHEKKYSHILSVFNRLTKERNHLENELIRERARFVAISKELNICQELTKHFK